MDSDELAGVLEGVLFGAGEAVSLSSLSKTLEKPSSEIRFSMEILKQDYASKARGIRIVEVKDTYQLSTKPEYFEYIRQIIGQQQRNGLSRAALETLAIIAYRQPITRHIIDEIRGVTSSKAIQRLLDHQLICEGGRLDAPGRPILYKTTNEFLKVMGFKNLKEMPDYEEFAQGKQEVFDLNEAENFLKNQVDVAIKEEQINKTEKEVKE